MKKKKAKTIGEMTNSRRTWSFDASTRIVKNRKGKGSYNRKRSKHFSDQEPFFI
ncbi:alternative ribosome rescue factor ArfA [Bacillus sp. 1P06AnD]|uniref:alternative ribosome rescue factor ArfA n=1 Tax=Bacillus sp. 1P06AnD TaxID=3132208 RepID=UPI0039A376D8